MKLNQIEITVPTTFEDIRLGQFQEYIKLFETIPEDERANLNEFVKMKTVSIFYDVPFDIVRDNFKSTDVDELAEKVLHLITRMTKEIDGTNFNPRFKTHNVEFGFIPDFEDMKAGEFADLSEYIGKWDMMHKAMSVMYRPVVAELYNPLLKIKQYSIKPYDGTGEYSELMKGMPAFKVMEASFFLSNSFNKLKVCLETYTMNQLERNPGMVTHLKTLSSTNGVGIKPSIPLQETMHSE